MKPGMSIRAIVRLIFGLAAASVVLLGFYGFARVLPRARAVRSQTEILRELYQTLAANQQALLATDALALAAVQQPSPATLQSLRSVLASGDIIIGSLPLAEAPPALQVPAARAANEAGRYGAMLEEVASLVELGRSAEARARLVRADSLLGVYLRSQDELRARGLESLLAAQLRADRLAREIVAVYVTWLVLTLIWMAASLTLFQRRLTAPLGRLSSGVGAVERGDLAVTIPVDVADEMGELTEHFNTMTAVLRNRATRQGQIAAAGELLAGAAHEVNNPLMAIAATAETRRTDAALSAAAREDLENISAEAHRAGQLLRAIIAFLRPSDGTVTLEDVNDLVRETWDLLWPQLRADGVAGSLELAADLPPVRGERQELQQMLVHLLSNAHSAVMQSPEPRRIELATWHQGGNVAIRVRDNGGGVDHGAPDGLFKPFTTVTDGRAGLGLYTARNIARAHDGELAYVPDGAPGAMFVVTLPAAERPGAAAAPAAAAEPRALDGLNILVVDDEPSVRRPIARFLARRGAKVREAADGREALGIALQQDLDLVLTDLRMPGMDGVSLYRALLERAPALAERVMFLSGDVAQLAELGAQVPAERVLTKPIELAELEQRIVGSRLV